MKREWPEGCPGTEEANEKYPSLSNSTQFLQALPSESCHQDPPIPTTLTLQDDWDSGTQEICTHLAGNQEQKQKTKQTNKTAQLL